MNGTAFDLEMQIFGTAKTSTMLCSAKKSALSVFFNIDKSAEASDFFAWQADAAAGKTPSVDLGKVISRITAMNDWIYGYIGSDTQPPCTQRICWYHIMEP